MFRAAKASRAVGAWALLFLLASGCPLLPTHPVVERRYSLAELRDENVKLLVTNDEDWLWEHKNDFYDRFYPQWQFRSKYEFFYVALFVEELDLRVGDKRECPVARDEFRLTFDGHEMSAIIRGGGYALNSAALDPRLDQDCAPWVFELEADTVDPDEILHTVSLTDDSDAWSIRRTTERLIEPTAEVFRCRETTDFSVNTCPDGDRVEVDTVETGVWHRLRMTVDATGLDHRTTTEVVIRSTWLGGRTRDSYWADNQLGYVDLLVTNRTMKDSTRRIVLAHRAADAEDQTHCLGPSACLPTPWSYYTVDEVADVQVVRASAGKWSGLCLDDGRCEEGTTCNYAFRPSEPTCKCVDDDCEALSRARALATQDE